MKSLISAVILVLGALALAACENPNQPDDLQIDPIQVERVDVLILESFPAQATARVQGVVGDGCSVVHSVAQRREGSTVTLTILRARPKDPICTQIALLYDEQIRLEGAFPPGRYTLRVNGVTVDFQT